MGNGPCACDNGGDANDFADFAQCHPNCKPLARELNACMLGDPSHEFPACLEKACLEKELSLALQSIEGGWFRKADGLPIGEILEGHLIWNKMWKTDRGWSTLVLQDEHTVVMEASNAHFTGTISLDAQATITWSDGDVWVRK
mmetsp:Transcript_2451/g.4186  ORF Transcript_2451/g.4186 Transcript_2451/m.4186 type:complete len:143 (+) Transcript_2451:66-494(+)